MISNQNNTLRTGGSKTVQENMMNVYFPLYFKSQNGILHHLRILHIASYNTTE